MLPTIFAVVHLLFGALLPTVNWAGKDSFTIRAQGHEELLDRCIQSGIEVRYRFEMRYCRRRSAWFDNCQDARTEIRTLQYDPVNEAYRVVSDRHGDEKDPEISTFSGLNEAIELATTVSNIPLEFIARGAPIEKSSHNYVGVRVIEECRGDIGGSLLDISYLLTFGLVKINRFDSGWIAFYLGDQN